MNIQTGDFIFDSLANDTIYKPDGKFFGWGSYWTSAIGKDDGFEYEWGRQWLDGIDVEFAVHYPLYMPTGIKRMKEI